MRYLGIDFSGGAAPWKARCSRPSVWIAVLDDGVLTDIRPVQALDGDGAPFDRLIGLLASGDFGAAGIDAPFSIPGAWLPPDGHEGLLRRAGGLPPAPDRPFPRGADLLALAAAAADLDTPKPLRETETRWRKRGINVRSSLWNGPRGGAPFAAASLFLLARTLRPLWPWRRGEGMIAEVFPAAQLFTWGAPHLGYGGAEDEAVRKVILGRLGERIDIPQNFVPTLLASADALDAVVACLGARGADLGRQADPPPSVPPADGWISVEAA